MRRVVLRIVIAIALATAIVWVAFNRDRFDVALLDAWVSGLGVWGPLVFVALYVMGTVVFFPGALFALAGGALFGPIWGSILNLVGASIGCGIAFLLARYLAGDWVSRKASGYLGRLIAGVEAQSWRFVAFVRLVPLFPFNLTNCALGLTRIGFLPYLATSFVYMAPGAVAYTWLGYAGRGAVAGDAQAIRYGLLGLGAIAAIAFLPRLIGLMRKTQEPRWTSPEELGQRIDRGTGVNIIDVRSLEEFTGARGHIPGARNFPLESLDTRVDELRKLPVRPFVLVCLTDKRSTAAWQFLARAGFDEVAVLCGGMKQWNALGRAVSRDPGSGRRFRQVQGTLHMNLARG